MKGGSDRRVVVVVGDTKIRRGTDVKLDLRGNRTRVRRYLPYGLRVGGVPFQVDLYSLLSSAAYCAVVLVRCVLTTFNTRYAKD